MEDTIIISDEEDDDNNNNEALRAQRLKTSDDSNIIDLTNNHCMLVSLSESESNVIDLTINEDGLGSSPVSSSYNDTFASSDGSGDIYLPSNHSSDATSDGEWTSGFIWAPDSETNSDDLQRDVCTSSEDKCLTKKTTRKGKCLTKKRSKKDFANKLNHKTLTDTALTSKGCSPLPTSDGGEISSQYATFSDVHYPFQSNVDSIYSPPITEQFANFANVNYQPESNTDHVFTQPTPEPVTSPNVYQPQANGCSISSPLPPAEQPATSPNVYSSFHGGPEHAILPNLYVQPHSNAGTISTAEHAGFPNLHDPPHSNGGTISTAEHAGFPNLHDQPHSNGGTISTAEHAGFPNLHDQPPSNGGTISTAEHARFPNLHDQPHNGGSMSSVPTTEQFTVQSLHMDLPMLYKLRCFKNLPVSHFLHSVKKPVKSGSLKPIPQSRMSIVNNTRDESIHQGTLYFLSEFVSDEHYPSKDLILHVIQSILLSAEEQAIKHEAYLTLMKVQKLHPANVNTVAWNWNLLSEVMERKENHSYHLFFQYVVQTLDDDFQIHLQRRCFKKSLCKKELSCDTPNIKKVISWLIQAVKNACDIDVDRELDERSECMQRLVFLLQRMLSIAVEVDNLPVTNSNRIADLLFPYVIVLKTRQQRELFFSSTENHLLRAKILEQIFVNSCEPVPSPNLPLSLSKILHFVSKSTLLLENQGPEWQRWDENLHHICLLFLSLQRIISDRLRTPITDRADEINKRPQLQLPFYGDVTEQDVESCMAQFWRWSAHGKEVPVELQSRFNMLKSLLLTAVKRPLL